MVEAKSAWEHGEELFAKVLVWGGYVTAAGATIFALRRVPGATTDDRLDALLLEFKELKGKVENTIESVEQVIANQASMRRRMAEETSNNSESRRKMDEMVDEMAEFIQRWKKRMEH